MNNKLDVRVIYYILISLYFIYYCFLNYFQNEFDFLHLYEIVLKVKENKNLYTEYNICMDPI